MKARFMDGFQLASKDEEFDLRFHVYIDQTDASFFAPNDRTFGKSGLYVPQQVRVYLGERLTRLWDYEVSLQRVLEGLGPARRRSLNFILGAFQIKFGRQLNSGYDWFDHLEQYFITPERSAPLSAQLRPLALSRPDGLGHAQEGRMDWAVGVFGGHLTGLADNNPSLEELAT